MTALEFHKLLIESISAFLKVCPNCSERFKDTLDNMILCRDCDREQKLNQLLDDKSNS